MWFSSEGSWSATDRAPVVISDAAIPCVFWLLGSTGVGVRNEKSVLATAFQEHLKQDTNVSFWRKRGLFKFSRSEPPQLLSMAIMPGWRQAVAQVRLKIWPGFNLQSSCFYKVSLTLRKP